MKSRGFTLIELLVVIAIIGVLSSVILASLNSARDRAKNAKAKQEILQIARAVDAARVTSGKDTLGSITGSYCSRCSGSPTAQLDIALSNVATNAGGVYQGLENIKLDPWGSLYLLDENEGEGSATNCTRDHITAGSGSSAVVYRFEYGTSYCKANPVGTAGFQ